METRRLNEAVKRNLRRFPEDFMFQLTKEEWENLMSQIATSSWGGTRKRFENNDVKTNEIFALLKELLEHKRELEKPSNPIGFRMD